MESLVYLFFVVTFVTVGGSFLLFYLLGRALMRFLEKAQRDQSVIVSELLAHRTLAETGNQVIAGQILAHSNAHAARTEMPQVWTPPQPEREELQPHESNTMEIGVDEDMEVLTLEET